MERDAVQEKNIPGGRGMATAKVLRQESVFWVPRRARRSEVRAE